MASIYSRCERYDESLEELETLLAMEGRFTVNDVKYWGFPERMGHLVEFQALMEKYALETKPL